MSDDLRERLDYAVKAALSDLGITGPRQHRANYISNAALSVLAGGIEIVTPHREGCTQPWRPRWVVEDGVLVIECRHPLQGLNPEWKCPAEAHIPEALLVSLVEAKEGS